MAALGERVVQRPEALDAAQPVGRDQVEEGGGRGAQHEDVARRGEGERAASRTASARRSAWDIERAARGGPYSFSMVHCSGCWFRRA